jgi:hypothetical protein
MVLTLKRLRYGRIFQKCPEARKRAYCARLRTVASPSAVGTAHFLPCVHRGPHCTGYASTGIKVDSVHAM